MILLSTYNGAAFLQPQLDSFVAQTHTDWILLWRDDGSTDASVAIVDRFAATQPVGRCLRLDGEAGRLGPTASFLTLLRAAPPTEAVAFADQDDVWLTEKLALGLAALGEIGRDEPGLYCARQVLVDQALRKLGLSLRINGHTGFPAALTQNIATGCTIMLNPAAARLVAASEAPIGTLHDWWSYLLVAAAGGSLRVDPTPVVLYRQHGGNTVGAPRTSHDRALAALRRGPRTFMTVFRRHVAALMSQSHLLSPPAAAQLAEISRALQGDTLARLRALRMPGLQRQTALETLLFRWWFIIG